MLEKKRLYIYILLVVGFCSCVKTVPEKKEVLVQEVKTPVELPILKLGNININEESFKNEIQFVSGLDSLSEDEILEDYIYKKRYFLEAISQGIDSSDIFMGELQNYKKTFLNEFSFEPEEIKKIANESYKFYQNEYKVRHIFLPYSKAAIITDTLTNYNKALEIRSKITTAEDFQKIALEYSKDPKTNLNGGDLGWLSTFNLVYPLEKELINMAVGSFSKPIKTHFGYHILYLENKRPNSGRVKVQHILKFNGTDASQNDINKSIRYLDSLRTIIKTEDDFSKLAYQFSNDHVSRQNGGILPDFGIGTREERGFEEECFRLKTGEISAPFKSSIGYHIIRMIEKLPAYTENEFFLKHERKFVTDSRAEYLLERKLINLEKTLNFKEITEVKDAAFAFADENILKNNWKLPKNSIGGFAIMNVSGKNITVKNFFDYIIERQGITKWSGQEIPEDIFSFYFRNFKKRVLLDFNENKLFTENQELVNYLKKIKEDLLVAYLIDKEIIEKTKISSKDLKEYFQKNKESFGRKEKGNLVNVTFKNKEIYEKYKYIKDKGKPYQLFRGIKPVYFYQNSSTLDIEAKRSLQQLAYILRKNSGYVVEVASHIDFKEDENLSDSRLKETIDFLTTNDVPITKISEVNHKAGKPADRFDWAKNQRVSFQFFSNFDTDLLKSFLERNPNEIEISSETLLKPDALSKYGLKWENQAGTKINNKNETVIYNLTISDAEPNFNEIKGTVLQHYQLSLEKNLNKKIVQKYPAIYNKTEVLNIIKNIKNQQ